MDFIDRIKALAARIPKQIEYIETEEGTKNALVMPFIQALGYNIFDPTEVVPEYTSDIGIKKGEKVDYAVLQNKKPILLFECKWCGNDLEAVTPTQLYRYFSVVEARIGIVTNGIIYKFYSDLEEPNKMDTRPFLVFDMLNIQEAHIEELKKLTRDNFNLEEIISAASDLKYTGEIKRILRNELIAPSNDFVKYFGYRVYSGKMTQSALAQFNDIVKRAFNQFISEMINERLKSALAKEASSSPKPEETPEPEITKEDRILTNQEEVEAFYIVKSILHDVVNPARVVYRDTISYFGILLDDNNRKRICRLYFNNPERKYIGLLDDSKKEEKIQIQSVNDIYKFGDRLKAAIALYVKE